MILRKIILCISLSVFVLGCKTEWEEQVDSLLPTENHLNPIKQEEGIITTINLYAVSGEIKEDSLTNYPLNVLEGKALKKWHKVSEQEFKDLEIFFKEEPINEQIAANILEGIKSNQYYVAYIYNFNSSAPALEKGYAHRDHEAIPGEKGYSSGSWIDMYYLNTKDKQLTHISYGKF